MVPLVYGVLNNQIKIVFILTAMFDYYMYTYSQLAKTCRWAI